MKQILVILDGLSEEKIEKLNNLSPLEYANTPTIEKVAKEGVYTKKYFCPKDRVPDSMSCILSILGVNENNIPENRAYLEALANDINVKHDEVVLRCNLISIYNNKLESFNGKGLSNNEMKEFSKKVKVLNQMEFYHLNDYRNIVGVKKTNKLLSLKNLPPHENVGMDIHAMLKSFREIKELTDFAMANQFVYKNRQYMFYPWGVSKEVTLPSFFSLHNKSCSCVCSADIMKGIAKAMKMDLPILQSATGDVDTDLKEKAKAVLNEISNHDVVIAHINGADEASHRMDLNGKINFIEKLDSEFLKAIYENIADTRLVILSDHQTSSISGKHEKGFVDYICNIRED